MESYKCQNCGGILVEKDEVYHCEYCRMTYRNDHLKKSYERIRQALHDSMKGVVSEELLNDKLEKIANARHNLYKARTGSFIDSEEVEKWAEEILKLDPNDVQGNFYALASRKKWKRLNKFMRSLNARENAHNVVGFVDYLTNGQFDEKYLVDLNDLIDRAFKPTSEEYLECHKKLAEAVENEESGVFDVELPRDVFVAYSSKDKEKAYELVEYLEENDISCFISMRNLAKGVDAEANYNARLKTAIDNCQVFLLVSSKNSRSKNCDAYKIEMRYVKEKDLQKAGNREFANTHYEQYLEENRNHCKKRVEYLIDEYGDSIYEEDVKKFFGGLTWRTDLQSVRKEVFELIENQEEEGCIEENSEEAVASLENKEAKGKSRERKTGGAISTIVDFFKKNNINPVLLVVLCAVFGIAIFGICSQIFKWTISWNVWQWIIGIVGGGLLFTWYGWEYLWDNEDCDSFWWISLIVTAVNAVLFFLFDEGYQIIFYCVSVWTLIVEGWCAVICFKNSVDKAGILSIVSAIITTVVMLLCPIVFELVGSWMVSTFGENLVWYRIGFLIFVALAIGIGVGIVYLFGLLEGLCY